MAIGNIFGFLRGGLAGAALLASGSLAAAADLLPTHKDAPPPAPIVLAPSPFFVKLGFTYAINNSSSHLYSQGIPGGALGGPLVDKGIGATIGNVATLGFEAGYYIFPNVSLDISGGIPMWANVNTKGTPAGGIPADGTRLAQIVPSFIPITILYHFTQLGAFQPYVGAGVSPVFSFGQKSAFNTGVTVDPTIGFVAQAGVDYMIDQHWGWSFDVKRLWASSKSHATGDDFSYTPAAFLGKLPIAGRLDTQFNPWVLSTGVVYRF
jgi:outer membrane protein